MNHLTDIGSNYLVSNTKISDNLSATLGYSYNNNRFVKLSLNESFFDKTLKFDSSIRMDQNGTSYNLFKTFTQKVSYKVMDNISLSVNFVFKNNNNIIEQLPNSEFRIKFKFSAIKIAFRTNLNAKE